MKLLYGTGNPAKLEFMRRALAGLYVGMGPEWSEESGYFEEREHSMDAGPFGEGRQALEILGLEDMDRKAPPAAEDGASPLENARQKALAYYHFYKMPVFSCDSGLYFDGLPNEVQPGVHVRTINGKYFTDEEMQEYYAGLAQKYGDLKARYHNAICLVMDEEHIYECMDESLVSRAFLITAVPYSKVMHKGFPLDSLSIDMETGKYFYELEKKKMDQLAVEEGCREFFRKLFSGNDVCLR